MGKQRQRTRIVSKVDELPKEIKFQVDAMIVDNSYTYQDISEYTTEQGYPISKSSIGRYAMRSNTAMQRLLEAQAQTEKLVNVIKKNPDADYTDAAMVMLMDGLINKMATAEEEFDEMPLDKAGRLVASLSRTYAYKARVKQQLMTNAEIAFKELEDEMMKIIKSDMESAQMLKVILAKAKERMIEND